jgi:hypothetical protein
MMRLIVAGLILCGGLMRASDFDEAQAARFARLALDCVHKEYPNKIAHSMNSDADVKPWLGSFAVYLVSGRGLK